MNTKDTEKAISVMQAYINGEKVQVYDNGKWTDIHSKGSPEWNWAGRLYRIKPKPITCWATVLNGRIASTVHMTEEDALTCVRPDLNSDWTVRKVVIE